MFIRNRARSRINQPGRTMHELCGTPTGPYKVARALQRRGVRVLSHFQTRFGPKFFEFFFGAAKILNFHPESCEIAQKSARPDDARPPQHSDRSSQGRMSTAATRPAGFVAFSNAFRTNNFRIFPGAARIFTRNRVRSSRNQPGRTTLDLCGTPTGPHKVG